MFLLVDCNNFFVSCERAFNPKLNNYPCVVLSNNDGCIIARSEEVKALGVPMGAPLFEWKGLLKKYNTKIFSPNFSLYGDISSRIMRILRAEVEQLEVYSIDEAFLHDTSDEEEQLLKRAVNLRELILRCTSIPTSIGIAKTKTLAKLASRIAKKQTKNGVFYLAHDNEYQLRNTKVKDIWGIGRRLSQKLERYGIKTAYDLIQMPESWIRNKLSITGLRTAMELKGVSCYKIETARAKKKSICYSRSFGSKISNEYLLKEALASFCSRAAEKLRKQNSLAQEIKVFLLPAGKSGNFTSSLSLRLAESTAYTPTLIHAAHLALEKIYQPADYKKVGLVLSNFCSQRERQWQLFSDKQSILKDEKLMHLVDQLNVRFGSGSLGFAASGKEKVWNSRNDLRSPCYTTSWNELLRAY